MQLIVLFAVWLSPTSVTGQKPIFNVTVLANESQCIKANSVFVTEETVYVACSGTYGHGIYEGNNVISINSFGNITILSNETYCPNPYGISASQSSSGDILYVACTGRRVDGRVISIFNNTLTTLTEPNQCRYASSVYSTKDTLYATCGSFGYVISIDDGFSRALTTSDQCSNPYSVTVNSATSIIYVACYDGGVVSINTATPTPTVTTIATAAQCLTPFSVAVNNVTGVVYVACYGGSGIISIDPTTKGVTTLIDGSRCRFPHSVFVDSVSNTIYATCNDIISISGNSPHTVSVLIDNKDCVVPSSIFFVPNSKKNSSYVGTMYLTCYDTGVIKIVVPFPTPPTLPPTSAPTSAPQPIYSPGKGFCGSVDTLCTIFIVISSTGGLLILILVACCVRSARNKFRSESRILRSSEGYESIQDE